MGQWRLKKKSKIRMALIQLDSTGHCGYCGGLAERVRRTEDPGSARHQRPLLCSPSGVCYRRKRRGETLKLLQSQTKLYSTETLLRFFSCSFCFRKLTELSKFILHIVYHVFYNFGWGKRIESLKWQKNNQVI